MRKIAGFLAVSLFLFSPSLGAAAPWWYSLEQGKFCFRGGDYSRALNAFEDARRSRRAAFERMEENFIILLSKPDVRRMGDALDFVEAYIARTSQTEAAEALAELYYRIPRKEFDNSVKEALGALKRLQDYPEAEYWIGEVYRVEGEPALAVIQYQKALSRRELLENPGFDLEILYKLAEIYRVQGSYNDMEEAMNGVFQGRDERWTGEEYIPLRRAMRDILGRDDGVTRFLSLYRYQAPLVEKAHRRLGFFYYDSGRHSPGPALDHLMFAFLIQNTAIIDEVRRRQYDYTFTTLDDLMEKAAKRPVLADYIDDCEYYKTVYFLASSLYGEGKAESARRFWTFLAGQSQAGQWRDRALRQLESPQIEKPLIDNPRVR